MATDTAFQTTESLGNAPQLASPLLARGVSSQPGIRDLPADPSALPDLSALLGLDSAEVDSAEVDSALVEPSLVEPKKRHWPAPADRWTRPWDWATIIWTVVLHAGAVVAPFYFTWAGFFTFLFMYWVTGSLGVCLGYHRLLTHGSFLTYRPVKWLFAWVGGLAGEGPAVTWVAVHRKHHAFSDQEGDPHSPYEGGWWSHMFWLVPALGKERHGEMVRRWAPDLAKDPVMRFLNATFLAWHIALGFVMYGVGAWWGGANLGVSLVLWGMFFRLSWVLHSTWLVNSASHIWGYRNYETTDNSRNLWWVGLLAFGEGWHNNHHSNQRLARHGHRWWEIDVTYWAIWGLERLGLAWNVVKYSPAGERAPSERAA